MFGFYSLGYLSSLYEYEMYKFLKRFGSTLSGHVYSCFFIHGLFPNRLLFFYSDIFPFVVYDLAVYSRLISCIFLTTFRYRPRKSPQLRDNSALSLNWKTVLPVIVNLLVHFFWGECNEQE